MKNYISSHSKPAKLGRINYIIRHNSRQNKPKYLLKDEDKIADNETFIFGNSENIKDYCNQLREKRISASSKKSHIRKNENEIIETVVALSEEQALSYIKNGQNLMDGMKQVAEDYKAKYGLEPLSIDAHYDEGHYDEFGKPKYNIHFHLTFYNFDFENNKSVLRTLHKKDFRDMQDLAADSMQKHNFDFIRGIPKEQTNLEHQQRNDFIISKQSQKLSNLEFKENLIGSKLLQKKEELNNVVDKLTKARSELKKSYTDINAQKNEIKALRATYERNTKAYSALSKSVKELTLKEKEQRTKWRELGAEIKDKEDQIKILDVEVEDYQHFKIDLKSDLKKSFLKNIKKSKKGIWEVEDIDFFFNEMYETLIEANELNVKSGELVTVEKKLDLATSKLNLSEQKNEDISLDLKDKTQKIKEKDSEIQKLQKSEAEKNKIVKVMSQMIEKLKGSGTISKEEMQKMINNHNKINNIDKDDIKGIGEN